MRQSVHIFITLTAIMLSLNGFSQEEVGDMNLVSYDENFTWVENGNEQIIVISIIDLNNHQEIEELDLLAKEYNSNNISFLAITDDIPENISVNLKKQLFHYKYLSKSDNERIFNMYQTGMYKIFPMHIVLNKEGEVYYKSKGSHNKMDEKLSKRIDRLMQIEADYTKSEHLQYTSR